VLRSEKLESVAELEALYKLSETVIVTHYHGLTVSQMTKLRKSLIEAGAGFKIVKNTLSQIAAKRAGLDDVSSLFAGPTAIAYSSNPATIAKTVVKFAETNDNLKIVGAIIDSKIVDSATVRIIANLPSLDELRGSILGLLQSSATNITRVLNASPTGLARVLQARAEKE